ncbi:50S ribosomal protein L16 arginine hydroxylase [Shewanella sp. NFH-SH190041]|uniref:cupin domain-containing protein n=1 Tax=Shewanella sp. NFH-SH190041 TaxID=2950245 RepID=UPI0021C4B1E6|nr:cupin domain-containing protein [Shewanella sp. NFH-SH190041]BDM64773.1 50S ribosomal protein L16 arginine hydroxylase [Shewanella sp. NFH-SH190041]
MQLNLNNLTPAQFLAEYWQKKPVVIRQGFNRFADLLSADELAGLAMEESVESRLIWQEAEQWQAAFGPFESYDHLGEQNWTLVVQALNNWLPEAEQLARCFDFIPRWRFDDVMASYAVPGGSVGPHIDRYDVFICQGSGRRRWRVGDKGQYREFAAHEALLHTEPFEPIIDVELLPGDILYLPPLFPHDGVTLEESMSFSVGFRTPSTQDMLSAFADYVIDNQLGSMQITDPDRQPTMTPGCIDNDDLARIREQLMQALTDDAVSDFAGRLLSYSKCQLADNGAEADDLAEIRADEWLDVLQQQPLQRLGGLRCHYFEHNYRQGLFYLNGEMVRLPGECAGLIPLLCNEYQLDFACMRPWLEYDAVINLMTDWIVRGWWYFDELEE